MQIQTQTVVACCQQQVKKKERKPGKWRKHGPRQTELRKSRHLRSCDRALADSIAVRVLAKDCSVLGL